MPILDVDKAASVIVMKRSMNPGFAGIDNELFLDPQDDDAVRRREGLGRQADRRGQDGVSVPFFSGKAVMEAVTPHEAYDAVREAFVAHARGEWTMQPKLYVTNYPAGDFRAMPALGGGHALLKWVTSFPGNPARGLPTVTGLVAPLGRRDRAAEAVLDAAAVTALRTAAAGVLAADTLCRAGASTYAVIGCGVNGAETARMLVAHGATPAVWDVDQARRETRRRAARSAVAADRRGGARGRRRDHRHARRGGALPVRLARDRASTSP